MRDNSGFEMEVAMEMGVGGLPLEKWEVGINQGYLDKKHASVAVENTKLLMTEGKLTRQNVSLV